MSVGQLSHDIGYDIGYDIVLANILAGTLISLAPTLDRHLSPGGTLILSGVLPAQADRVQQAFAQYNFRLLQRDDWVALQGQRTAG
jgi:ribosomal protein L11 methyltransferase